MLVGCRHHDALSAEGFLGSPHSHRLRDQLAVLCALAETKISCSRDDA